MIDLALEPNDTTRGEAVVLSDLDEDWEDVAIRVRLVSAHMTFEKGANVGTVIVRRNQTSLPTCVEGIVVDDADLDMIHVRAFFDGKGGHYGDAERAIELVRKQAAPDPKERTVGEVVIEESRRPPDMTIRILSLRAKDAYDWEALSYWTFGPGNRSGEITIDESATEHAAQLRSQVVQLQPGQHLAALRGFGDLIWNLTPSGFRDVYWAFRQRLGANFSIQLVTDEPHIQWELMKPFNSATSEEAEHLMLDHPIARWVRKSDGNLSQRLPRGAIATFAPGYPDTPQYRLPFAVSESVWLCTEFGAIRCTGDRASFLKIMSDGLPDEKIGILHFAGHGSFDGSDVNGILMDDAWVRRIEVDHRGTKLGEKDGTFVVFNACDVGNVTYTLGMVEGWASLFTQRKFSGFVAPLWRVADRHASEFVRTFVKGLHSDQLELGEAMRRSREATADLSPTPFAYVCYGDVLARAV
ncbi:CHAT domain-containing protein [Methylorubrum aminovorans]|nr:CHAT domain-containing protein [Methylorubrum aminovorans]